ncbi:hypothetical protein Tco_1270505 [Tanacetum coccineum]
MLSSAWFLQSLVLRLLAESAAALGRTRTELITPDLICPSTYQLLRNSGGDSEPDSGIPVVTSDLTPEFWWCRCARTELITPKRLFSLARVSLVEAS